MSSDGWDDWDDNPRASKQRDDTSVSRTNEEWDDWDSDPRPAVENEVSLVEIAEITAEYRKYLIDLVDEKVRMNLNEKLARNTDFGRFMDYYYKVSQQPARHSSMLPSLDDSRTNSLAS